MPNSIQKAVLDTSDPQNKRWWLRLREKNGKVNDMPCHHKLEFYLDAYLKAAGIGEDRKAPLFLSAIAEPASFLRGPWAAPMSGT